MKIIYSDKHRLHNPRQELSPGYFEPYHEMPDRALYVHKALQERGFRDIAEPDQFPLDPILRIHDAGFVAFLEQAWDKWRQKGREGDAFPHIFNVQHPDSPPPSDIDGLLGYYCGDGCVPFTQTSWEAIRTSAFAALTAQKLIAGGERSAFAVCRPPGHHATTRVASGFCYLNNAAIAAQAFIDGGAKRVAVLDIDYHHGNGTQDIFYERDDVLFVSIHADPARDYPYYRGYANEKGRGKGEGFTVNYPLALKSGYDVYGAALADAVGKIRAYGPDALVVSLGVDTYKDDPISFFLIDSPDYLKIGAALGMLNMPALFALEGGYAVEQVGHNVVNVLAGYLGG